MHELTHFRIQFIRILILSADLPLPCHAGVLTDVKFGSALALLPPVDTLLVVQRVLTPS